MPLMQLTMDALPALTEQANAALDRVCRDLIDRPRITKPRKVTVEIELVSNPDDEGADNYPEVNWSVRWSVPGSRSITTRAFVEDGQVLVNPGDGHNPRQMTLEDAPENVAPMRQKESAK
jgi:hypothetical protein